MDSTTESENILDHLADYILELLDFFAECFEDDNGHDSFKTFAALTLGPSPTTSEPFPRQSGLSGLGTRST